MKYKRIDYANIPFTARIDGDSEIKTTEEIQKYLTSKTLMVDIGIQGRFRVNDLISGVIKPL